jgi:hypothetical protein
VDAAVFEQRGGAAEDKIRGAFDVTVAEIEALAGWLPLKLTLWNETRSAFAARAMAWPTGPALFFTLRFAARKSSPTACRVAVWKVLLRPRLILSK